MSLIAHYRLDGNTNEVVNGLDGTPTQITYGTLNKAADFDGTESEIVIPASEKLNLRTEGSVCAWIYLRTHTNWKRIFMHGPHDHFQLDIRRDERTLRAATYGGDGEIQTWTYSRDPVPMNRWVHCMMVFGRGVQRVYLDGELQGEDVHHGVLTDRPNDVAHIGSDTRYRETAFIDALIDDVRVYDHMLSPREIRDIYQAKYFHLSFDRVLEPTNNIASQPLNSYSPYHDINRNGQDITMNKKGDGQYLTIGIDNYSPYQKTLAVSGYMKKNGIPYYPGTDSRISTYQRKDSFVSTYFNPATGYFESIQNYDKDQRWIYHMGMDSTEVKDGDVITIEQFQVEEKDHVTEFTPNQRDNLVLVSRADRADITATLTLANSPEWFRQDIYGKGCYRFNGVDQTIVTDQPLAISSARWTVIAWYFPITFDNYGHILTSVSDQNNFACKIGTVGNDKGKPYFYASDSFRTVGSDASKGLTLGEWNHLAYVFDGNSIKIYLNGERVVNVTSITPKDIPTDQFQINGGNGEFVQSKQADTRVYLTALSESEIIELYRERLSLDNFGNAHCKVAEPRRQLLIDSIDRVVSDQIHNVHFTINAVVNPDLTDFVEDDNTLGNAYIEGWAYCTSAKYYPTTFELTKENNARGVKPSIAPPPGGWQVGWNYFFFVIDTYRDIDTIPWWTMDRIQLYRSGEAEGVDSGERIHIKDVYLVKSATNKPVGPMSVGPMMETVRVSEIGPSADMVVYLPLDVDVTDYAGARDLAVTGTTLTTRGHWFGANDFADIGSDILTYGLEVSDGLALWYPLDSNVEDYIGEQLATNNGASNSERGYSFDGQNAYIEGPTTPQVNATMTAMAWVNTTSTGEEVVVSKFNQATPYTGFWFGHGEDGTIRCCIGDNGQNCYSFGSFPNDGNWHHIAIAYDGTTLSGYVDGELVTSYSDGPVIADPGSNWRVGRGHWDKVNYFSGLIDDVRIYDRALNAHEIDEVFNFVRRLRSPVTVNWDGLTLCAWINVEQFTDEAWIYSQFNGGNGQGFIWNTDSQGRLRYANYGTAIFSDVAIATNEWYHVAVTRNHHGVVTHYINGVFSGEGSDTPADWLRKEVAKVGNAGGNSTDPLTIRDFRIYRRALAQYEIAVLKEHGDRDNALGAQLNHGLHIKGALIEH